MTMSMNNAGYVYPLVDNCKAVLCAEPKRPLGFRPRPEHPNDWAEEEFATVELYDHRLKDRLFIDYFKSFATEDRKKMVFTSKNFFDTLYNFL